MPEDRIAEVIEKLLSLAEEAANIEDWATVDDRARRVLNTRGASPDARREAEEFLSLAGNVSVEPRSRVSGDRSAEPASRDVRRARSEEPKHNRLASGPVGGSKDPVPVSPAMISLFYSYADADAAFREVLLDSLAGIRWFTRGPNPAFQLSEWHRDMVGPGEVLEEQVAAHISSAHVIILMISPAYLADQFKYEDAEVTQALLRAANDEARIVPVLLKPTELANFSELGKLKPLPSDDAVTLWSNQDAAFKKIAEGISLICNDLANQLRSGPAKSSAQRRPRTQVS